MKIFLLLLFRTPKDSPSVDSVGNPVSRSSRSGRATSLVQFTTDFYADSVEWCPESNLIACGNYQLEESAGDQEKAQRKGCIYLLEAIGHQLNICDQVATRGILDQKWFDESRLGVVTSIGELVVYQLDLERKKLEERAKVSLDESEETTIALSLDYWKEKTLVSDSKGNITVFDGQLRSTGSFAGHDFEAWTCALDRSDENIFYSGGDDCCLNTFDIRVGDGPTQRNSKCHRAGVTSIAFGLPNPDHFLTGSYDEQLRLFDRRAFARPVQQLSLGGGIWRIKLNPVDPTLLLCACMYHNFSIVRVEKDKGFRLECVLHHGQDKICYGADWGKQRGLREGPSYNFATCSFYDNLFSLNEYSREASK